MHALTPILSSKFLIGVRAPLDVRIWVSLLSFRLQWILLELGTSDIRGLETREFLSGYLKVQEHGEVKRTTVPVRSIQAVQFNRGWGLRHTQGVPVLRKLQRRAHFPEKAARARFQKFPLQRGKDPQRRRNATVRGGALPAAGLMGGACAKSKFLPGLRRVAVSLVCGRQRCGADRTADGHRSCGGSLGHG